MCLQVEYLAFPIIKSFMLTFLQQIWNNSIALREDICFENIGLFTEKKVLPTTRASQMHRTSMALCLQTRYLSQNVPTFETWNHTEESIFHTISSQNNMCFTKNNRKSVRSCTWFCRTFLRAQLHFEFQIFCCWVKVYRTPQALWTGPQKTFTRKRHCFKETHFEKGGGGTPPHFAPNEVIEFYLKTLHRSSRYDIRSLGSWKNVQMK